MNHRRFLVLLLRVGAVLTLLAFPAMLLPTDWMAATHGWLGLGEFPRVAVTDYLTRSIAALYGFHGVLLLLISRDPVHHRSVVRYVGWMNVLLGLMLVVIDLHAGLPVWWIVGEGPPIAAFGVVILYLIRSLETRTSRAARVAENPISQAARAPDRQEPPGTLFANRVLG